MNLENIVVLKNKIKLTKNMSTFITVSFEYFSTAEILSSDWAGEIAVNGRELRYKWGKGWYWIPSSYLLSELAVLLNRHAMDKKITDQHKEEIAAMECPIFCGDDQHRFARVVD